MAKHRARRDTKSKKIGAVGIGSAAFGAAFVGIGSGTASADIDLVAPAPVVTSRQATMLSEGALRYADYGQARGLGDSRSGDLSEVSAQGEVGGQPVAVGEDRSSTMLALPGTRAVPFNFRLNRSNGVDPTRQKVWIMCYGAPLGSFGGCN